MAAAQRMYDNSYDQRLETAASAKAYLETAAVKAPVHTYKEERQVKNGRMCNGIAIVSSLAYCLIVFALVLLPLVHETYIHRVKIDISSHRSTIKELELKENRLKEKINSFNYINVEQVALTELNMVKREDALKRPLVTTDYITFDQAKKSYYNTKIDYMSKKNLD